MIYGDMYTYIYIPNHPAVSIHIHIPMLQGSPMETPKNLRILRVRGLSCDGPSGAIGCWIRVWLQGCPMQERWQLNGHFMGHGYLPSGKEPHNYGKIHHANNG